jgi:predicted transcriptional regulator YdeE
MPARLCGAVDALRPLQLVVPVMLWLMPLPCGAQSPTGNPAEATQQQEGWHPMQPKIVHRDAFRVLGTLTPVKRPGEDPQTFVAIWNRFESFHDRIKAHSTDGAYYGVQFATDRPDTINYLAGMAVGEVGDVAEPLVTREVPAGRYAVFECPVEKIGPTYGYIFGKWLPTSEYKRSEKAPVFEQYPPADDTQSPVLIHILVK